MVFVLDQVVTEFDVKNYNLHRKKVYQAIEVESRLALNAIVKLASEE